MAWVSGAATEQKRMILIGSTGSGGNSTQDCKWTTSLGQHQTFI